MRLDTPAKAAQTEDIVLLPIASVGGGDGDTSIWVSVPLQHPFVIIANMLVQEACWFKRLQHYRGILNCCCPDTWAQALNIAPTSSQGTVSVLPGGSHCMYLLTRPLSMDFTETIARPLLLAAANILESSLSLNFIVLYHDLFKLPS
jgi:hypothetical protein